MTEREILMTRISHEKRVLKTMPSFSWLELDRAGIEREIEQLEECLKKLEAQEPLEPFRATIAFNGPQVQSNRGIQVDFATTALSRYTGAIKAVGKELGGIQRDRAKQFDMQVTNVSKGSFGFVLEPMPTEQQTLYNDTLLSQAIEKTNEILLASAEKDDDAVTEAISDFSDATISTIHGFAKFLSENESTCYIGIRNRKVPISGLDIIEKRLDIKNIEEKTEKFLGNFEGILPHSRKFEFRTEEFSIDGNISNKIEENLTKWMEAFFGKKVQIEVFTRQVGSGKKSYTIIAVPQMRTTSEDECSSAPLS
ncbi:MAG: hypothetical protein Q4D62_06330 [Planctomycetia bacterium]|nr:hypothetical protein [Planctomycetia bacterium]